MAGHGRPPAPAGCAAGPSRLWTGSAPIHRGRARLRGRHRRLGRGHARAVRPGGDRTSRRRPVPPTPHELRGDHREGSTSFHPYATTARLRGPASGGGPSPPAAGARRLPTRARPAGTERAPPRGPRPTRGGAATVRPAGCCPKLGAPAESVLLSRRGEPRPCAGTRRARRLRAASRCASDRTGVLPTGACRTTFSVIAYLLSVTRA